MAILTDAIDSTTSIYTNVSSDQIQITEDKLKLKLKSFEDSYKYFQKSTTFGGVFFSMIATLCTAEFHSFLGVEGKYLKFLFITITVLSAFVAGYELIMHLKHRKTIDVFIKECKNIE